MGPPRRVHHQIRGASKLKYAAVLLSILPLAAVLVLLSGDIPDPDRNAHDMWAQQLLHTGKLVISENGITDNWRVYYPNTVPKPLETLIGILRAPGGSFYHSLLTALIAGLVLWALWQAAGRGSTGGAAALYLGLNPVFIFLCIRGNPAIPFLGAAFLLQTASRGSAGAVLASLARPEGFIYGIWHSVTRRKWKLLLLLFLSAGVWLAFHRITCGSFTWTSDEVRYSVAAMDYPTPNPVTFFPWAGLRSILILGAPGAAILFCGFRRWDLKIPFTANFVLLAVSLAFGSLVLPRYIDQLFLLATPFIFRETARLFQGRTKLAVTVALTVFPSFQWIATLPEIEEYIHVRNFYESFDLQENGVTAANELLIPGIALANGIFDPRGVFVSTDRAAWEGATEEELTDLNVTELIVLPLGVYFPVHTEVWLHNIKDIEVNYFR